MRKVDKDYWIANTLLDPGFWFVVCFAIMCGIALLEKLGYINIITTAPG